MKINSVALVKQQNNKNNNKFNMVAFGYSFFLKGIPKVACAYCSRPTLSIPEINHFAQGLEHGSAIQALPIFQKIYNALDNSHKVIIDILNNEIAERPKVKFKKIIVDLANKFEDATNQRYSCAINNSLNKSQIRKGSLQYRLLNDIIEDSRKKFLSTPDNKSGQKVLKITAMQNGVIDLIKKFSDNDDKKKLKIFLKEMNSEFKLIKMDPSTFFAKFGKDSMSSFLGSLSAPIRATADHIVTAGRSGLCDSSNYILSCGKCNWDRSDKTFKDFINLKPDMLIPNIVKQFEQLDFRLLDVNKGLKKLTPVQQNELLEYLSVVPNVIQQNAGRTIDFNLPNTQDILASRIASTVSL